MLLFEAGISDVLIAMILTAVSILFYIFFFYFI